MASLENLFIRRYIFGQAKGSVVRTMAKMSVGGIAIGILAMIVVLSIMDGFDQAIKNRLLGVEPHLVISGPMTGAVKNIIEENNGEILEFTKQDVIIRTVDGIYSGGVGQGISKEKWDVLSKSLRKRVDFSDTPQGDENVILGPKEIAMGSDLARSLGVFEGDEVTLVAPESLLMDTSELPLFEKVKVKALVRTNVQETDSRQFFYDIKVGLKKLNDTASLKQGYEVRFKNPDTAIVLAEKIKPLSNSEIQTWQSLNSALFYSLKMEIFFMGIFLGLTVLISSFSIVSVLSLIVTEKTSDVGILKALGAKRKRIKKIFLSLGMFLGLVGVFGGVSLGLATCWILKTYPIIRLPDIYYDTTLPINIDFRVISGIVVLGFILTWLGALIPARKITEFDPVKALRPVD